MLGILRWLRLVEAEGLWKCGGGGGIPRRDAGVDAPLVAPLKMLPGVGGGGGGGRLCRAGGGRGVGVWLIVLVN